MSRVTERPPQGPGERPDRPSQAATRRTEGVRVQGRSARVVEAVLTATAEELGRVGFLALRIEDVAALSGVNKTTIYRRWATKEELVASVISELGLSAHIPDTGSVKGDLLALLRDLMVRAETPVGRGIVRLIQAERGRAEFAAILHKNRAEHMKARRTIFERGIARGELPKGTDSLLLSELSMAPVVARLLSGAAPVDDGFIRSLVDVIVAGAQAGAAVVSSSAESGASSRESESSSRASGSSSAEPE